MSVMGDLLYSIDPNTMVLMLVFIILYVLINFALKKVFKKERASATIISLCVSLLAVYGMNRMNLNLSRFMFDLGISEDLLYSIVPWVVLGLIVLASFVKDKATGKRKFRLYAFFMILGALLVLLGALGLAYQQTAVLIAGAVSFLIGLILWIKRKRINKKKESAPSNVSSNGRDSLINAAKKFRGWAKSQPNPKFVGSWANFVNYLKRGGWGNNEAEICQRLNISQRQFAKIFKRYGLI